MEYIGKSIWEFVFETSLPFWIKGVFLLCLLVVLSVAVFLTSFASEKGRKLGRKNL
jgi:hypothetical protein